MTSDTRDLLIHLVSHMSYMQGQLEAHHQYDEPEDYYWYRESVALREKVQLHLATTTLEKPLSKNQKLIAELLKPHPIPATPFIHNKGHTTPQEPWECTQKSTST
jgi:hypothetical protein